MGLPEVSLNVKDGALGLAPNNTNGTQAAVGVCSSGVANTVYAFGDIQTMKDTLGTGPLVEFLALLLATTGGPVVAVKTAAGTAGSNSAVTAASGNTGLSVMTVTGTPLDAYGVIVKVVTGGTNPASGVVVIKYSLDNGNTYSADIALPTSGVYPIPNTGLTLNFSAATLVANDSYSFTSTAPAYTVSELNTALDALLADARTWFCVNIIGVPATGQTATVFAAVSTKMATAETQFRFAYAQMQAADDIDSTLITAQASMSGSRVSVGAGFEYLTSAVSGAAYKRPAAWVASVRAGKVSPGTDPARVRDGAITSVVSLIRDEFKTPGLDAVRYTTLRSYIGRSGAYLTNARLMSAEGSDFRYVQHRRIMDIACTVARAAGLNYLNDTVRVDATTGLINEVDARAIDTDITEQVRAAVLAPGYVSDASARVDRTVNILSTGRLPVAVRIVPLGYLKAIEFTIGFLNPALTKV